MPRRSPYPLRSGRRLRVVDEEEEQNMDDQDVNAPQGDQGQGNDPQAGQNDQRANQAAQAGAAQGNANVQGQAANPQAQAQGNANLAQFFQALLGNQPPQQQGQAPQVQQQGQGAPAQNLNAVQMLAQLWQDPQGQSLLTQLMQLFAGNTNPHAPNYGPFPTGNAGNPLDLNTSQGFKQFTYAIDSLYGSGEEKFGLEPSRLLNFMERLEARARRFGWMDIFQIPNSSTGTTDNFLQRYGRISLQDVLTNEGTYIGTVGNRNYQSSIHLQECVYNSLTEKAQSKIRGDAHMYTANNGDKAGVAYLKAVLLRTTPTSNSNVNHIRRQLANLDKYMKSVSSNVESSTCMSLTYVTTWL